MRAFVIRGFGQQAGIDFERVHEELIRPALAAAGIDDGGPGEVIEAGSVRADRIRELCLADIVVADVSVQDASVLYELGARHAARRTSTVLICARADEAPLGLGGDRYLRYDPDSLAESVPELSGVLRAMLADQDADHTADPPLPANAPNPQAPAPGQNGQAVTEDQVLKAVWRAHRQWSIAAATARKTVDRWRKWNLSLLVAGAVAAAFAVQSWTGSVAETVLAAVSAVLLAFAGWVQGTILTPESTARWTGARAASEALKAETWRYLAGVAPYAGADRDAQLKEQFDTVQTRAKDLRVQQLVAQADNRPLPAARTFAAYVRDRAQEQADWHQRRIGDEMSAAGKLRSWQLGATVLGVVLAALAAVLTGWHLAVWTAAATTIAAAFATYIAATQHQRVAASYAATADQLQRLVDGMHPQAASADQQAQFVADVERVLAVQNDGWVDLLGTAAKI